MKKIIPLFFILNILCGLATLINYELLYKYSSMSIPIIILFIIFYITSIIIYFKKKEDINNLDLIITTIYIIFMAIILVFSILYQNNNGETYNMMYFTKFLLIPHILYIIINLIKTPNTLDNKKNKR